MVKQHIIISEEEYCVQILTQILQTLPKSQPGSETRDKNPGVKSSEAQSHYVAESRAADRPLPRRVE